MALSVTLTLLPCLLVSGVTPALEEWLTWPDYRVPQQLYALGCFTYAPDLDRAIRAKEIIPSGSDWEKQLRGCSIWTVELIRQQILADHPDAKVNAILIDFLLYDLAKEREAAGQESIPHHRTRSIWY